MTPREQRAQDAEERIAAARAARASLEADRTEQVSQAVAPQANVEAQELPPLPSPVTHDYFGKPIFSAEQMRSYAVTCIVASQAFSAQPTAEDFAKAQRMIEERIGLKPQATPPAQDCDSTNGAI